MMNVSIQHLAERLRHNAEFRLAKQEEFPSDQHNTEAAAESERLAAAFDAGEISHDLVRAYTAFSEDERTMLHTMEVERELVAGIGFRCTFADPNALLREIIEQARGPFSDDVDFVGMMEEDEASIRGETA